MEMYENKNKDENKITPEDLVAMFRELEETSESTEAEKSEKEKKEDTIINAFSKNPEDSEETLNYLKDKEQKLEDKYDKENDSKKKEGIKEIMDKFQRVIDNLGKKSGGK
jgi:hypothetical protein